MNRLKRLLATVARVPIVGTWVLPWKRLLVWRAAEYKVALPASFRVDRKSWDGPSQFVAAELRKRAHVPRGNLPGRPGGSPPGALDGPMRTFLKGARPPRGPVAVKKLPFKNLLGVVPTRGPFSPGEPHYFVVHTTSGYGTGEDLAGMFQRDGVLGVEWCVDYRGKIYNFGAGLKCNHVGPQNYRCEGVELVGFAVGPEDREPNVSPGVPGSLGAGHVWTREDWLTHRRTQLDAVSALIAYRCAQLNIPIERASNGESRDFVLPRGVVGHINCPGNDHNDPGVGWPWALVLGQATEWSRNGIPPEVFDRIKTASKLGR